MAGLMDLFITIGVEDDASNKIAGITKNIGSGLAKAAKIGVAAVAAVGTGAVALGTAFANGAMQVAAYGDNIDKMSQKMGLSAEAYQEWDFILQHSGASIDSMQRGMMTLTQAAENGSDAFAELGLSQEDIAGMSQDKLFAATISGLQGIEDEGQRAVLAQKLLGASAKELGPLLNTSAEDTEAMRQQVHELGGVMSDEAVKASAQFQDSLQNMKTALNGVKMNMMTQFLPSMSKVTDGLAKLFSGDSGGINMITEGIKEFTSQIQAIVPDLIEAATAILEPVIAAIAEVLPDLIVELLPVVLEGLTKIIVALAGKLPEILAALWEALKSIGTQLWPVLEETFAGVGGWFKEKFDAAWAAIKGAFDELGITEFFGNVWGWISGAFSAVGTWFTSTFGDGWEKIKAAFVEKDIGEFFAGVWSWITSAFSAVSTWFSTAFTEGWAAIKAVFDEKGVTEFFTGVWGWITSAFAGVKEWFDETFAPVQTVFDTVFGAIQTAAETAAAALLSLWEPVKEFFEGLAGIISSIWNYDPGDVDVYSGMNFAIGNDYIPYDGYKATLHKGEAVLTAREAEEWRRGEGSKGVENVFNFYGVSQSDMEMIADYVNRSLA